MFCLLLVYIIYKYKQIYMNIYEWFSYLKWYFSLNSTTYFESNIHSLNKKNILSLYNQEISRWINNYEYIDREGDKIIRKSFNLFSPIDESCLFIGTGFFLDNTIYIPNYSTIFLLSGQDNNEYKILEKWRNLLETYSSDKNIFLLNKEISKEIQMMIFTKSSIIIRYYKKLITPYSQKISVSICLIMICCCVISIFYLVCGIYSSSNPIITEFELQRFSVVKYEDLPDKSSESCLICFDNYEDQDDIRILLCDHYFHKKCVDKWLCEQSSRCPYCRYTNKNYAEI